MQPRLPHAISASMSISLLLVSMACSMDPKQCPVHMASMAHVLSAALASVLGLTVVNATWRDDVDAGLSPWMWSAMDTSQRMAVPLAWVSLSPDASKYLLALLVSVSTLDQWHLFEPRPALAMVAALVSLVLASTGSSADDGNATYAAAALLASCATYALCKPPSPALARQTLCFTYIGVVFAALGARAGVFNLALLIGVLLPLEFASPTDFLFFSLEGPAFFEWPMHATAGATASASLVMSCRAALSPSGVVCGYLRGANPVALSAVFALALFAKLHAGPVTARHLNRSSGSLMLTNLVFFWLCFGLAATLLLVVVVSAASSSMNDGVTAALVAGCVVVFEGAASALNASEEELLRERTLLAVRAAAERQRQGVILTLTQVSGVLGAVVLAHLDSWSQGLEALAAASALCTGAAAVGFSFWYVQNRLGSFRVVDQEGRLLLSVTG